MPLENPASRQDNERLIERLRATLSKLEVALGATRDAIAWTDERGRIEWCNAPFDRLAGKPHMSVIGQDIVKAVPLDKWSVDDAPHPAKAVLASRSFLSETLAVKRDGQQIYLDFFGSWAQGGGVKPIAVFVLREVTARVMREEQLRRATAILRAQLDSTQDGLLIVDENARIVHYNKRFLEMWAISEDVMQDADQERRLAVFLERLDDGERAASRIRELMSDPARAGEDELRLKNGLIFERYSAPISGPDGAYYGRAWHFRDVTERRKAEQALENKSRELERSNAELQQFASAASHDLMEPLRKVASFGDLLRKRAEGQLDPQSLEFLTRMQNAAVRMGRLIEDLLQFSRVFGDTRPFETVDLKRCAEEVAADLEVGIKKAGGRVTIGELPTIQAHPFQMRQLFQNLIANALKFRKPDVPPLVTVRARPAQPGFVELEVADNGIGFEERFAEKIFQPFLRLHPRSEYEGTGLGLSICRRIATRHGGWISAQGRPGADATFVVTLPLGRKP